MKFNVQEMVLKMAVAAAYLFTFCAVVNGLRHSGYKPEDMGPLNGDMLLAMLVLSMITVAFIFWMSLPKMLCSNSIRGWSVAFLLFPGCLGFTFTEVLCTMTALEINANSDGAMSALRTDVDKLKYRAAMLERQTQEAYQNQLDVFKAAERDARSGQDGTNIAECGSNCLDALRRQSSLKQRYGALTSSIPIQSAHDVASVSVEFGNVQVMLKGLAPRIELYRTFSDEYLPGNDIIEPQYNQLVRDADKLGEAYFYDKGAVDSRSLVLVQTMAKMKRFIFTGKLEDSKMIVPMIFALIPQFIVFSISLIFWQEKKYRNEEADVINQRTAENKATIKAYDGLKETEEKLREQRINRQYSRKLWETLRVGEPTD